jgi:hypothetical protein
MSVNNATAITKVVLGNTVTRAAAVVPATTTTTYFTITGGIVLITALIGRVTAAGDGTANSLNWVHTPTVGAVGDVCAATVCTSDAIGTLYSVSGIQADVMSNQAAGGTQVPTHILARNFTTGIYLYTGALALKSSATDATLTTEWTLTYVPVTTGAAVAAA